MRSLEVWKFIRILVQKPMSILMSIRLFYGRQCHFRFRGCSRFRTVSALSLMAVIFFTYDPASIFVDPILHVDTGCDPCKLSDFLGHIFVTNLPRCKLRREHMASQFGADFGIPVEYLGFDTIAENASLQNPSVILQRLGVRSVAHWLRHDPYVNYFPHTKPLLRPLSLGNLVSHFMIYQQVVDRGLPAALILEDDLTMKDSRHVFIKRLSIALSNLEKVTSQDGGWDLLYLEWNDISKSRSSARKHWRSDQEDDPGLQVIGCYGSSAGYIISQAGARKMIQLKHIYARRLIPIDDFLMSLSGHDCPWAWDVPAAYWANINSVEPYRVLRGFSTKEKLFYHGSQHIFRGKQERVGQAFAQVLYANSTC